MIYKRGIIIYFIFLSTTEREREREREKKREEREKELKIAMIYKKAVLGKFLLPFFDLNPRFQSNQPRRYIENMINLLL